MTKPLNDGVMDDLALRVAKRIVVSAEDPDDIGAITQKLKEYPPFKNLSFEQLKVVIQKAKEASPEGFDESTRLNETYYKYEDEWPNQPNKGDVFDMMDAAEKVIFSAYGSTSAR